MPKLSSAAALVAYAETLFQEGRVLLVGNSASGLADLLVERGARAVHVWDPNAARVRALGPARRGEISVETLSERTPVATGFDLLLVENLKAIKEPSALLRKAKKALARRGVALIVCDNAEAESRLTASDSAALSDLDYYSLYDVVADEFPVVRMLGQAPFVGYAVADFAPDGAPVPSVDTTLLKAGAEQPEAFVALASFEPIKLEAFSLVQLPLSELEVGAPAATSSVDLAPQLLQSSAELTRVQAEKQVLKAEHERTRSESQALKAELERAKLEAQALKAELERAKLEAQALKAELERAKLEAQALKAEHERSQVEARALRATVAQEKLEAASAHAAALAALKAAHERTKLETAAMSERSVELRKQNDKSTLESASAQTQVAHAQALVQTLELQLAEIKQRSLAQAQLLATFEGVKEVDASDEVSRFEQQLKDQGAEFKRLEAALENAHTVGRALALEVEQLQVARARAELPSLPVAEASVFPGITNSDQLTQQLTDAYQQAAVREADFQVLLWTVERLEEKLGMGARATDDATLNMRQRQAALAHQVKAESRTS